MKKVLLAIVILAITGLFNLSFAQDHSTSKMTDEQKMRTPYVPEKTSRAPVNNENNIMFMTHCPPRNSSACLKIPLDASFVVPNMSGGTCNAPASPSDPLQRNDDGVNPAAIPIPFTFNLYGTSYTSVYINNNGNMTFGTDFCTFTPFGFPSSVVAMVAPFFADVDSRNLGSGVIWMKIEAHRMTVIWDSVGYYNEHVDKLNEFEVIISDGTDPLVGIGNNVCFSYGDMQWTTGDASGGIGGFFGSAATVGVNKGDGVSYATLGRFDRPGTYYGGPSVDTNGISSLDCETFCFNASNDSNICPVAENFPPGDTVHINGGTLYTGSYQFSAPEVSQITTGGVTGVPPGMSVTITNGITCNFDVSWMPSCTQAGVYTVCFSGADNAVPPCTTTVCVRYIVDCPSPVEMSAFTSSVDGRNVSLNWATTTEMNNSRFEIERSANNTWQHIGVVNGNGTSNTPHSYSFVDRGLSTGNYNYRLKQFDYNGAYTYHNLTNEVIIGIPNKFELAQNYPNPFNPSTKIDYSIPFDGKVSLTIYDAMGRQITRLVDNNQQAGYYSVNFNASNFASGIYYYRLEVTGSSNFVDSKKMLLVK